MANSKQVEPQKIPQAVADVLREHQSRVNEAIAILELASDLITEGDFAGEIEGARAFSAIDGAIRLLKDVDNLDDSIDLFRAAGLK